MSYRPKLGLISKSNPAILLQLQLVVSILRSGRAILWSGTADFRPEKADLRSERGDFRPQQGAQGQYVVSDTCCPALPD